MTTLVVAHFLAGAVAPALLRALGRRAFLVLALVPLTAFGWVLTRSGRVSDGAVITEVISWVPALDLQLAFAMGTLQWVMALVVSGIGALVLAYCAWYVAEDDAGLS